MKWAPVMRRRPKDVPGPRRPLPPHVRRHTYMVTIMRLALPVLAAVLLASLALWSKLGLDSTHFTYNDTNSGAASLTPVNNQGAADVTVSPTIITTLAGGMVTVTMHKTRRQEVTQVKIAVEPVQ